MEVVDENFEELAEYFNESMYYNDNDSMWEFDYDLFAPHVPDWSVFRVFLAIYHPMIMISFGILATILMVYMLVVFIHKRLLDYVTCIFIMNIIAANAIILSTFPLWVYACIDEWNFGYIACCLFSGFYETHLYVVTWTVFGASLDKYLKLTDSESMSVLVRDRTRFSKLICACTWIVAFVMCIPYFFYSALEKHDRVICTLPGRDLFIQTTLLQTCFGLLLPMFGTALMYVLCVSYTYAIGYEPRRCNLDVLRYLVICILLSDAPFFIVKYIDIYCHSVYTYMLLSYLIVITESITYLKLFHVPLLMLYSGSRKKSDVTYILMHSWRSSNTLRADGPLELPDQTVNDEDTLVDLQDV